MTSRINKYFHYFPFRSVSFARHKQKIDADASQSHKSLTAEGRWRFEEGELNLRIDFFELSADSAARLRLHKEFPDTAPVSDVMTNTSDFMLRRKSNFCITRNGRKSIPSTSRSFHITKT